jgi:ABC-type multidrug transport system fused ATPase/permease subunit
MVPIVIDAVLSSAMGTAFTVLMARSIDDVADSVNWNEASVLIGAIVLIGVAAWGLNFLRQWFSTRLVGDVVLRLREDAFASVMAQDLTFFNEHPAGGIVSRVSSDTQAFAGLVKMTIDLMGQALLILFMTFVLFYVNARLALVTMLLALVIVAVTVGFRRLARRMSRSKQHALALLNAHLQESLGGIFVAKNFRQERTLYDALVRANDQWFSAARRMNTLFSSIFPFMFTVAGLGTVVVVYFGGQGVLAGTLTPGEWYLFLQSVVLFWSPLTSVASFWSQFQQGLAAGERVFALLDAEPNVRQIDYQSVQKLAGRIEFRNVTFRYTDRETVLKDFDLIIEAGETVALVGHTGAGKSTIIRLIARSYEYEGGQILVDGQDIRTFDLNAYRRHLGIVPQMPFLFSGTVADSIRYARPNASDEEVTRVARRVAGGDWLESFPRGLQSPVGELGRNLAAGQRQLIALARVLLQDPAILILDEATASVDPLTEAQIQEGLDVVLKDRTSIIIAHRLPTVRKADRIVVLHEGRIIEQGSHDFLIRAGGYYGKLYNLYFRHQLPDFEPTESNVRTNV